MGLVGLPSEPEKRAQWVADKAAESGMEAFVNEVPQLRDQFRKSEYNFLLERCNLELYSLDKLADKLKSEPSELPPLAAAERELVQHRYSTLCEEIVRSICRTLLDMASQAPAPQQEELATARRRLCRRFLKTAQMLNRFKWNDFRPRGIAKFQVPSSPMCKIRRFAFKSGKPKP